MTDERDSTDEIEGVTSGDEGLWADVLQWVDATLAVFGDLKELAQVGLIRSLGVKLCNWLWGVEGAIRRLIIAEALKFDRGALAETRPRTNPETAENRPPCNGKPTFRIFGFIRQVNEAEAVQSSPDGAAKANLPAYRHIPFPADPLLSIGKRPGRTRTASLRRLNPLDRRGRISRFDPDYGLDREEDFEASLLGLSPSRRQRPCRPRPEPVLTQERPGYLAPRGDAFDWKRIEEEWKRVIPAPHLGTRVFALSGILARHDQAARRIARLFNRYRERAADVLALAAPELAWPRHARSIYRCREVEDLVPRSHALLWRLDTR